MQPLADINKLEYGNGRTTGMRVVFAAGWKGGREVGRAHRGRARGVALGVAAFFGEAERTAE